MWPSPGEPAAKTSGFSTGDAAFAHAPGPAPASSWPALRPAELQSFLLGVVRRTHGFDLVPFEDDDADLSTLRDVMQACVQVAIEALGLVIDRYDRDAGDHDDDTSDPRVQQLVDVAFMGRMGLTERRRVLGAAAPDDRWALLETASIASREILMSLSAVEALLTAIEGLRADNSFYKIERERALRARYAFFRFRQDVPTAAPAPVLSEVARHVRYAALGIARLASDDVYPHLRVSDRLEISRLQQRLLGWLRDPRPTAAHRHEGERLWNDATSFADILQRINERPELCEYDVRALRQALHRLHEEHVLSIDLRDLFSAPHWLLGRHPMLDRMLQDGPMLRHDAAWWLEHIVSELEAPGAVHEEGLDVDPDNF